MLGRYIDQIGNVRGGKLDLPVGKGLLFLLFDGILSALAVTVGKATGNKVPFPAVHAAFAVALKKIGPVRNFLGENGAELGSFVSVVNAIDDIPKITDYRANSITWTIQTKLQKLMGGVSSPEISAPELAAPELASPEAAAPAPEFSAPFAEGDELLNSVERKFRAIKGAESV